jgi:hypothetical protein
MSLISNDVLADRALVINGLLSMGTESFCDIVGRKLKQEKLPSVLDIVVPQKHNLPAFGFVASLNVYALCIHVRELQGMPSISNKSSIKTMLLNQV